MICKYIPNKNMCTCSLRDIYKNVHTNSICNHLKLETASKSINRRMNKQIVVYSYNKIFLSKVKEQQQLHITTWVNLKNTLLSERGQRHKNIYCKSPFM